MLKRLVVALRRPSILVVVVPVIVGIVATAGRATPDAPDARARRITIVAAGDIACRGCVQRTTARDALRLRPTAVLTLGDNAYPDGTSGQFTRFYDPTWGDFKGRTHPSPGNHEYHVSGAAGYFAYFGAAAHRPGYYRFTMGGWRLISLNSDIARGARSSQTTWLRKVLKNDRSACVLAYWHSPLRSSGTSHGDDASVRPFWKALYAARADVILNGHEHNYERFARMTPRGSASPTGVRQFVVGTGGADLYPFGKLEPTSQVRIRRHGVLRLALRSGSYTWSFRSVRNEVLDRGTTNCH